MHILKRRDWFPIVATDLFSGLLCAVIVFDAVSPKAEYSSRYPAAMTLTYSRIKGLACGPPYSVVLSFEDADGHPQSSFDATSNVASKADQCVETLYFRDLPGDGSLTNPRVLIVEYPAPTAGPTNVYVETPSGVRLSFSCLKATSYCEVRK